ncbi:MAG: exo-alpha-sialidase [Saprospiraceae bacterium]|nr:exo-alpha-sialidase [Saprospiraceae bacterium]
MNRLCILILIYFVLTGQSCQKEEITEIVQPLLSSSIHYIPLYSDKEEHNIIDFNIHNSGDKPIILKEVFLSILGQSDKKSMVSFDVKYLGQDKEVEQNFIFGKTSGLSSDNVVNGRLELAQGGHKFTITLRTKGIIDLKSNFNISKLKLQFENAKSLEEPKLNIYTFRHCLKVRSKGQDNCDTYRIPGLITTNTGTLVAVYDNRYNNSLDLQEHVDIGMSRSTDGGASWEPMKVIMDMGEWGGKPQNLNGIGDPCILYDPDTKTIWVAALWMSGLDTNKRLWWASGTGMSPEETGQFILTKSTDDGVTWSPPINITSQIKNPEWQLLLQGPGMGITLTDGTLVFPAQFKANIGVKALDGGAFTCHSTIVYSEDKGKSWQIGTGAKTNTTEAQVVQLSDGSLMLNMRDDRNRTDKSSTNGRAISVTKDLGKTWMVHPTSNSALPESNCMASLISTDLSVNGKNQKVLFFSNPNHNSKRSDMTIKMSLDEGLTWPEKYQIKLNGETGYGYSCLTMVDEKTVGILYEGTKDLYFQKISVDELISK